MFRIRKKEKTPNLVWDAAANRLLCKFVKGVFETDDRELAEKLQEMGYLVEEEADEKSTGGGKSEKRK